MPQEGGAPPQPLGSPEHDLLEEAGEGFVRVATVRGVPPGTVRLVEAGGRRYALVNLDGVYYALDNNCPHQGGPLSRARLRGRELECPWHQWRWDVTTGRSAWPRTDWRVLRAPVRVVGDQVYLRPV